MPTSIGARCFRGRSAIDFPMSTKAKIVYLTHPVGRLLTEEEVALELQRLVKDPRLEQAVVQVMQVQLAQAVVDASDLRSTERATGHAAGRIEAINEFLTRLFMERERAKSD